MPSNTNHLEGIGTFPLQKDVYTYQTIWSQVPLIQDAFDIEGIATRSEQPLTNLNDFHEVANVVSRYANYIYYSGIPIVFVDRLTKRARNAIVHRTSPGYVRQDRLACPGNTARGTLLQINPQRIEVRPTTILLEGYLIGPWRFIWWQLLDGLRLKQVNSYYQNVAGANRGTKRIINVLKNFASAIRQKGSALLISPLTIDTDMYIRGLEGTVEARMRGAIRVRLELEKMQPYATDIATALGLKRNIIAAGLLLGVAAAAAGPILTNMSMQGGSFVGGDRPPDGEETDVGSGGEGAGSGAQSKVQSPNSILPASSQEDVQTIPGTATASTTSAPSAAGAGASPVSLPDFVSSDTLPPAEQSFVESAKNVRYYNLSPIFPRKYLLSLDNESISVSFNITSAQNNLGGAFDRLRVTVIDGESVKLFDNYVTPNFHYKLGRAVKPKLYAAERKKILNVTRSSTDDFDGLSDKVNTDERIVGVVWVNDADDGTGTSYSELDDYYFERDTQRIVWRSTGTPPAGDATYYVCVVVRVDFDSADVSYYKYGLYFTTIDLKRPVFDQESFGSIIAFYVSEG